MFAFVQLYPIRLNDVSGPELIYLFWHVEGFVDEFGETI